MATIGTFDHIGDSGYLGDIFTLSLRAKNVRIVSVSRTRGVCQTRAYSRDSKIGQQFRG